MDFGPLIILVEISLGNEEKSSQDHPYPCGGHSAKRAAIPPQSLPFLQVSSLKEVITTSWELLDWRLDAVRRTGLRLCCANS